MTGASEEETAESTTGDKDDDELLKLFRSILELAESKKARTIAIIIGSVIGALVTGFRWFLRLQDSKEDTR